MSYPKMASFEFMIGITGEREEQNLNTLWDMRSLGEKYM